MSWDLEVLLPFSGVSEALNLISKASSHLGLGAFR